MDDLLSRVRAKDYTAPKVAKAAGEPAVAGLVSLLRDPDDEVRQIAVYCLDEIGGAEAAAALVSMLDDPDAVIGASAARALHHHPDPRIYRALLRVFDRPDPAILREIPLIIARMEPPVGTRELAARNAVEAVPEAKEGLVAALAKLGDPKAREDFAQRLRASSGPDRKRLLDLAELIHQPWLLKPLAAVLDDPSPMVRIGIDGRPELPDTLRACDIALVLIAEIAEARFTFPVNRATNYTPEQLAEVKAYVAGLP
jgi:HEAT repeat protein